jgi:hypothetical protein
MYHGALSRIKAYERTMAEKKSWQPHRRCCFAAKAKVTSFSSDIGLMKMVDCKGEGTLRF